MGGLWGGVFGLYLVLHMDVFATATWPWIAALFVAFILDLVRS